MSGPGQVPDDELVSLADFAELAFETDLAAMGSSLPEAKDRVLAAKQSAIRMLRRSHPGFPDTVRRSGRTSLYPLGELTRWWSTTRPEGTVPTTPSAAWLIRLALRSSAQHEYLAGLLACIHLASPSVVARLARADDAAQQLRSRAMPASKVSRTRPQLAEALEYLMGQGDPPNGDYLVRTAASAIAEGEAPAELLEDLARHRPQAGPVATQTAGSLARLIVAAAPPTPNDTVVDLAAGEGRLLLEASQLASPLQLIGYEPDRAAWAFANARLALNDLEADLQNTFSLPPERSASPVNPPIRGDVVFVDPPLQSRKDFPGWLALATNALKPGGRAVVALTAKTLGPGRKEWATVGRAHLEAVALTPNRLRSDNGVSLALWILSEQPGTDVLIVDASTLGTQRGTHTHLRTTEAEAVAALLTRNRANSLVPDPKRGLLRYEKVSRQRIAERDGDLRPQAWFEPPIEDPELVEAEHLAGRLAVLVNGPLQGLTTSEQRRAVTRLSNRLANLADRKSSSAAYSKPRSPDDGGGASK